MSKWLKSFGTSVVSWALVLNIGAGSTLLSVVEARAARATGGMAAEAPDLRALHKEVGDMLIDPMIGAIENSPHDSSFDLHLSATDPLVDQDPFFLRAQSWTDAARNETDDVLFTQNGAELVIQARGQSKAWHLGTALKPVLATDEYIYLAAPDDSYFAARENGQGLFVVPYQKLLASSGNGQRVPVFFMPLPGTGWTGAVAAEEIPHRDLIVIRDNTGTELPVTTEDIRSVVKVESMNMLFAVAQAMDDAFAKLSEHQADADRLRESMIQAYGQLAQEAKAGREAPSSQLVQGFTAHNSDLLNTTNRILGGAELDLPRGSTAGYGMLYTGFDLAHPERGSTVFTAAAKVDNRSLLRKALDAIVPSAYALDPQTAKFLAYTTRVLAVSGGVFIAGIVARHTLLKKKAEERIRDGLANGDTKVAGRLKWDILAHSLTAISQIPAVWSAQTLRFVLDRANMSENGMVRKLFNATFGFGLKTNDRTPVNAKTLVMGVGVLGGVDTALVAVQGYFLLQWMAHGLAWIFPALAPRVHMAYDAGDASVSLYLMLSVIQNFVAWMSQGAYSFAHDVQTFKTTEGERAVSDAMRSEGKNPTAPENKSEYDRRVKEYVREAMKKAGLPDEKDFLFDANTIYSKILGFFGYSAPEGAAADAKYRAIERPGLMPRALKRAIVAAQVAADEDPASLEKKEALAILTEARTDMSLLKSFAATPVNFLTPSGLLRVARTFKSVRQSLTATTLDGQGSDKVEILPESWTQKHPDGAQLAAQTYRSAYFTITENADPANPWRARVGNALKAPFKFVDRTFERWQVRRAFTRAAEKYKAELGEMPADDVLNEEYSGQPTIGKQLWDKLFQRELVRAVGLFPDYKDAEFLASIEEKAATKLKKRLEDDKELQTELAQLEPTARNERIALQSADYFAESFTEATIQKEVVSPLSPQQPGVFQRIRQLKLIANSGVATRLLRGTEGLMSNTRYSRGLWSQMTRTVPMLEDITQGNLIVLKNLPAAATVAYWWTALVWGTAYPRMTWIINTMLAGATIRGPWMTTMRITSNLGIKPGDKVMGMVKYGVIGSFATMWGMFFFPMFKNDIVNALHTVGAVCQRLLLGG